MSNADGDYRCHWEAKDDEYGCSQLWPTTTILAPDCCYGAEQNLCKRKGCSWRETAHASDCELTMTETPDDARG